MDLVCEVCDSAIIEKEFGYYEYLATLRKKDDKRLYKKFTTNNTNLDEVDEILNDYVTTHNKKFYFSFVNCEFKKK